MKCRISTEFQINKYIFVFCISAHIGWLYETIYTSIRWQEFAERGYLQLPLCPIYGFGAVVLLLLFGRLRNTVSLFIIGTITTTLIELLASYILEYCFQLELWTYKHWSLNFQGRISIWSSVLFGIMTVLLIKLIEPLIVDFLKKMDGRSRSFISILMIGSVLLDILLCVNGIGC